jgi:putative glutamine amidotransferase
LSAYEPARAPRAAHRHHHLRPPTRGALPPAGALRRPGEPRWREALAVLDGVVLTGGGDLDPQLYGGASHPTIYNVDAERDRQELALARAILDEGLPTLGICRGMQVLNVALGGTLIEHLPAEVGETVLHRAPPREPVPHTVAVEPRTRLAAALGLEGGHPELPIVSWHHQAVRAAGAGARIGARASDGVIEAFELPEHPWLLAVQWHPELSAESDPRQQRLFDELLAAAARGGGRR